MNLDEFFQQVEVLHSKVTALLQGTGKDLRLRTDLLKEEFKQLGIALQELRIAFEEQKQQNSSIRAALVVRDLERQHYLELFQQVADSYLVTDVAGIIQSANRAACTLFSASQQFLVGKPLEVFVAEQERQFLRSQIAQLSQVEPVKDWEVRLIRHDSQPINVAVSVAVLRRAEGEPSALCWLLRDLTKRKRAEKALRQQAERERLVTDIAQRIRSSLNLEEILNTTVAQVREFLQADRTLVYQFQSDWSGAVVVESVASGWTSMAGMTISAPIGQMYVESLKQGQIIAIENIYTAGLDCYHIGLVAPFQAIGKLVVPILVEEQLWGLLVAHQCSQPRQWQQLETKLLQQLALQVAIAIHQAQLYEQTQYQLQREQALNRVTQAIRNSLDLETIFTQAVDEIGKLLQVDRAELVQYLPERKLWLNVADYRYHPSLPVALGVEIPDEGNAIAARLKQLEIVKIDDTSTLSDSFNQDHAQTFPGAWLLVPLHLRSQIWGSLTLVIDSRPHHWQEEEVELACSIAAQLALAIQQAHLYKQMQYQVQREQALNQVTQAIRSSLDLETIFTQAVNEIGKLLQVDHVTISQYLPQRQVWLTRAEYRQSPSLAMALGVEVPDADNPIAAQLKQLQVVKIDDTGTCSDSVNREIAQTFPGAWLLVPLHFRAEAWGSLCVLIGSRPHRWQEEEVELAYAVASQLAIAIQQSQLYQQLHSANQELHSLALKDGLTNIANRRCFDQYLEQEWQRQSRSKTPLSLILCDVDRFKAYNDIYGHQMGDDCLRQVAAAINRILKRPADLVARYGGEEFGLILPNTEINGAMHIAEEIRSQVKALAISHPNSQCITLSLGVACIIPNYKSSPATLIAAADRALYQAKEQGRDRAITGNDSRN